MKAKKALPKVAGSKKIHIQGTRWRHSSGQQVALFTETFEAEVIFSSNNSASQYYFHKSQFFLMKCKKKWLPVKIVCFLSKTKIESEKLSLPKKNYRILEFRFVFSDWRNFLGNIKKWLLQIMNLSEETIAVNTIYWIS